MKWTKKWKQIDSSQKTVNKFAFLPTYIAKDNCYVWLASYVSKQQFNYYSLKGRQWVELERSLPVK